MAVKIGSARIDERGKARGGRAGDNNGREVSTQNWYNKITNPWVLLRPKNPTHAERIARCMEKACANPNIGYDQGGRDTLYAAAAGCGFDVSLVKRPVETDCSALVRVCCAYAGISARNFRTTDQAAVLMATGCFDKFTASKYAHSSAYLRRGDILVTTRQGHTVVVLSNGSKALKPAAATGTKLGDRMLDRGDYGADVAELQTALTRLKFDPKGIDKDFGPKTEKAVKKFQKSQKIEVDGVVGPITVGKLQSALKAVTAK